MSFFFPDQPRALPGHRWIKISMRGLHVLCAGILTGSYVLGDGDRCWLFAALGTGGALLLIDLIESAAFLLEVRGLIVVTKLAILAALPYFGGAQAWVLMALVVFSVISSHAPASFRHRLLFGRGRVTQSTAKG